MSAYDDLSLKRRKYVDAYLETWNKTRAADEAGYSSPGQQGYRLFKKVQIQAAIKERLESSAMKADELLARLAEEARASIADFITSTTMIIPSKNPDKYDDQEYASGDLNWHEVRRRGHLIKKISFNQYGPVIEMIDTQAAQFKIGEALGLFKSRTVFENPDGSPIQPMNVVFYIPDNGRKRAED